MRSYILLALLIVLYLLPWLVNPSASLTPNAYDLAEWTSLHPTVHAQTPELLTSLLLRLPLACAALLIAFTTRRGFVPALIVIVFALALLPPELILPTDNPNSRQQQIVAIFTLAAGLLGLSGHLAPIRSWIAVGVALAGAIASTIGLMQGYDLMHGFALPTQIGLGGVSMALLFALVAGGLAIEEIRRQRVLRSRRIVVAINQTG